MAGQHDSHDVGAIVGDPGQKLDARHAGHSLVGHDHVDLPRPEEVDGFLAAPGRVDLERLLVQGAHQARQEVLVVVDQQDVSDP